MWVAFANAKATHIFFSKNISVYAIYNDQSFNDIVSFEQLGPDFSRKTSLRDDDNLVFYVPFNII